MSAQQNSPSAEAEVLEPAGVIDTIGLGFALLNRRPYLIWIPVLLDATLWLGWRTIAIDPTSIRINDRAEHSLIPEGWSVEMLESLGDVELMNLVTALVPTLMSHQSVDAAHLLAGDGSWTLQGAGAAVALMFTVLAAVMIVASYLTVVARLVNDEPIRAGSFAIDCLSTAARGVIATVAGLMMFLFLMSPFLLISVGLSLVEINYVTLLFYSAVILGSWLGLFFLFSVPAIALGQRRVTAAMQRSYQVVQHHILAVIALLVIFVLIRAGMPYALSVFTGSEWSIPFAIVVHAYIVTGLLASLMLFFRHRDPEEQSTSAVGLSGATT
jgi:hypothetical protein